ncbi:hypothetical protein JST97_14720 [bacterium]|nr:hypothetical protein [bacterium]
MNYLPHIQRRESLPDETYSQPLVGELLVVFVDDGANPLTRTEFETLKVAPEALMGASLDNLERRLTKLTGQEVSGLKFGLDSDRPVFTSLKVGQGLEASLLLLPHVWQQLATRVSGDLLVGVPGTDRIMFTGSEDFEGQLAMRKLADAAYEHAGSLALSRDLLVWRESGWQIHSE